MSQIEVRRTASPAEQLLCQAITTVEGIQDARAALRGVSARLDDKKDHLDTLLTTLWLIRDEVQLHTPAVQEQSQAIMDLARSFQHQLDDLGVRYGETRPGNSIHTLIRRGSQDDQDLEVAMNRLEDARQELTVRICKAEVGLNTVASVNTITRVDAKVYRILGQRLSIAYEIERPGVAPDHQGQVPLPNRDVHVIGVNYKATWIGNKVLDLAEMFNCDTVDRHIVNPTEKMYKETEAHNRSFTLQGQADPDGITTISTARTTIISARNA